MKKKIFSLSIEHQSVTVPKIRSQGVLATRRAWSRCVHVRLSTKVLQYPRSGHRVSWLHEEPGHDVSMFDWAPKCYSTQDPVTGCPGYTKSLVTMCPCSIGHQSVTVPKIRSQGVLATRRAWSRCVHVRLGTKVLQYPRSGHRVSWLHEEPGHDVSMFDWAPKCYSTQDPVTGCPGYTKSLVTMCPCSIGHQSVTVPKIRSQGVLATRRAWSRCVHVRLSTKVLQYPRSGHRVSWLHEEPGHDVSMFDWAPQCYSVNRKINRIALLVLQWGWNMLCQYIQHSE